MSSSFFISHGKRVQVSCIVVYVRTFFRGAKPMLQEIEGA